MVANISLIAAMNPERVIGKNNQLPWHVKSDLQNFKALTLNRPIIMGRKTFESLGKPLPKRTNIVITRDPNFKCEGIHVFNRISDAIDFAKNTNLPPDLPAKEIMIIGGEQIFEQSLEDATKIYLTIIQEIVLNGDAHFPEFENLGVWKKTNSRVLNEGTNEPKAVFEEYTKLLA